MSMWRGVAFVAVMSMIVAFVMLVIFVINITIGDSVNSFTLNGQKIVCNDTKPYVDGTLLVNCSDGKFYDNNILLRRSG